MNAWNRIFWKNARTLTNSHASQLSRMRYWRTLCYGVSDHRLPGIRLCSTTGKELEGYFNKFVRRIVKVFPSHGEDVDEFCRRRNRVVAAIKEEAKVCVTMRWCFKITTWLEHLHRHTDTIGHMFMTIQNDLWLRTMRCLVGGLARSWTTDSGATGTRASPGRPNRILGPWYDRLRQDGCFDNPERSKALSKEHATRLYALMF